MWTGGFGNALTGGLQHALGTGDDPVPPGVSHASNNLLTRKSIKHKDLFALMSRKAETIIVYFIDSQSEFFGARLMRRLRFRASLLCSHGIS
jgi:hypothetical protein